MIELAKLIKDREEIIKENNLVKIELTFMNIGIVTWEDNDYYLDKDFFKMVANQIPVPIRDGHFAIGGIVDGEIPKPTDEETIGYVTGYRIENGVLLGTVLIKQEYKTKLENQELFPSPTWYLEECSEGEYRANGRSCELKIDKVSMIDYSLVPNPRMAIAGISQVESLDLVMMSSVNPKIKTLTNNKKNTDYNNININDDLSMFTKKKMQSSDSEKLDEILEKLNALLEKNQESEDDKEEEKNQESEDDKEEEKNQESEDDKEEEKNQESEDDKEEEEKEVQESMQSNDSVKRSQKIKSAFVSQKKEEAEAYIEKHYTKKKINY